MSLKSLAISARQLSRRYPNVALNRDFEARLTETGENVNLCSFSKELFPGFPYPFVEVFTKKNNSFDERVLTFFEVEVREQQAVALRCRIGHTGYGLLYADEHHSWLHDNEYVPTAWDEFEQKIDQLIACAMRNA